MRFSAADHELHVDVAPVRLPDALVRGLGRVLLHQSEQPIAVDVVAPERQPPRMSVARKYSSARASRSGSW